MVSKVLYALVVAGISIESSRLTTVSYTVGPVCAKCSDGYSFRQSTQECEPCRRSGGMDALTIIFLILLAVLLRRKILMIFNYFYSPIWGCWTGNYFALQ